MGKLINLIAVVLVIILAWGFIGGNQAKDTGITCDFGFGENNILCWNWHQNLLGDVSEGLENTGQAISDWFEDNS